MIYATFRIYILGVYWVALIVRIRKIKVIDKKYKISYFLPGS